MKKASLKDIAESLGVSKALVSLVLNGKGGRTRNQPPYAGTCSCKKQKNLITFQINMRVVCDWPHQHHWCDCA
ncbi:MAG: LacI family DNA-binding transcriptional regulator [Crocinitomicaceae bacterium]|nr:LacI family DNA-binding transcriptional regulator [Crocinitomicaceae bacterium]